jgi:hypothetical protein
LAYIGNKPANKAVVASDLDPAVITGQTALAVAPADTDEFLISDAGTLKRLDASLIGGGGKILQVVEASTTTAATTTSTSYASTGLEVAITPSATSSKVLVFATWGTGFMEGDKDCRFQLYRDSTAVGGGNNSRYVGIGGGQQSADNWFTYGFQQFNIQKLDSPSSTSELTYKLMFNVNSGSGATGRFGEQRNGDDSGANVICAMEIGA